MSTPQPVFLSYEGDGEFKAVSGHWARICDKQYVVGERYRLSPHEERSINSHNHYFASIHEAFVSLPEHLAERFLSEDHLRRYALVKAGYCTAREILLSTKADALRVAEALKANDPYALVDCRERVVIIYTPKSQSCRAMPKGEFQASKDAVLRIISEMIGVEQKQLEQARAA